MSNRSRHESWKERCGWCDRDHEWFLTMSLGLPCRVDACDDPDAKKKYGGMFVTMMPLDVVRNAKIEAAHG